MTIISCSRLIYFSYFSYLFINMLIIKCLALHAFWCLWFFFNVAINNAFLFHVILGLLLNLRDNNPPTLQADDMRSQYCALHYSASCGKKRHTVFSTAIQKTLVKYFLICILYQIVHRTQCTMLQRTNKNWKNKRMNVSQELLSLAADAKAPITILGRNGESSNPNPNPRLIVMLKFLIL